MYLGENTFDIPRPFYDPPVCGYSIEQYEFESPYGEPLPWISTSSPYKSATILTSDEELEGKTLEVVAAVTANDAAKTKNKSFKFKVQF